jgi:hypothetical protein
MNLNKLFKVVLFILSIQFGGNAIQGMGTISAPEVYFLPKNIDEFNQRLMGLLDNAKDHVFVAMYWLTDTSIINKLISLKQRGIDVQIIFDESVDKYKNVDGFVQQLLQNKIIPYVLPNTPSGIMHNKFVVIDGRFVVTGSANFTATVFNKVPNRFNNENIVIFNSSEIAAKYGEEFLGILSEIAAVYVEIIATGDPNQISNWIKEISYTLYEKDARFKKFFERKFNAYGQEEQRRLTQFFNPSMIQPVPVVPYRPVAVEPQFSSEEEFWEEPATLKQKAFLKSRGIFDETLSKEAASELIRDLIESPVTQFTQHQVGEPLTYSQKHFLESRRVDTYGMSKQQASQIIGNIKRAESRPYYK